MAFRRRSHSEYTHKPTPPNHLTLKTGSNTNADLEKDTQQQNTGSDKEKAFVAGVNNNQTKNQQQSPFTEADEDIGSKTPIKTSHHWTLTLHQKQITHELLLQSKLKKLATTETKNASKANHPLNPIAKLEREEVAATWLDY